VIAKYMLGDENANAFVAGGALTSDFIKNRPDVAKRFTADGRRPSTSSTPIPGEARKHLAQEHLHAGCGQPCR
jgi:NitT/TauT family transport system substrate-binding protein